jgi:alpha-D-xyloside xylohydrolase
MVSLAMTLFATPALAALAAKEGNKLVYRDDGQTVVIQAWGRDSLRVRVTPDGGGQTSDWALDIPLEKAGKVEISPKEATLRNGKISVRIHDTPSRSGHMQFFRHSGDKQLLILNECNHAVDASNPGARTFKPVGDGLFSSELQFAARDGERLYGMGENAANAPGKVNLKGCTIDLFQRHMKAVVPLVISSEGYGFLWNNPSLGKVEFGKNRTRWISYGSKQLDYFITAGDSYADIMENYADATGHAPKFPYWASGFWQCKLRYQTQEEFLGVAREFKRRGLPLSVLVIDFFHWDVFGNWKLDPKCWPDPKAMVKELDEMGVRIMISPWTLVDEKSENFAYMKEHGLFTGSIGGKKDTVNEFGRNLYQYDPTNPYAARYLWSKWKANYVDLGIRTFWLDPCDEFHQIQDYDQVLFHIGPAKECHAWFPVAHQKNIYEGLHAAGEKEVVTICRNAWAGSQRYGACPAPHDINCSFEDLERYMKVGLNVMMSGIPWWSCDTGFVTPDNSSPRFQELMVRWYQYEVFLPVFRTHACRPNNEPWNIGGKSTYQHIRASLLLRERLRPYVMEQMKLASERGLPPMRPLCFDFMDDPKAAAVEDEYLFGPDFLVAPITKYEMRSREVYLPAGVEWTDAWTGKKIHGGQAITADAPIEHIPVYIRGDKPALRAHFRDLYELPKVVPGVIEAESLKVQSVSRGRVEPQNMTPFGNHWSDDSQMVWWGGLSKGDQLVLEVPVDKAGSHELQLHLSKAEDYGIFSFQLDDGPASEAIDLFAPKLQPPMLFRLKSAMLTRGNHRLKILYLGQNPRSRNSLIGMDYLVLKDVAIRGLKPE